MSDTNHPWSSDPAAQAAIRWIAVSERLPKAGEFVLAACGNEVVRAMHVPRFTLSEDEYGEFDPEGEYDERTDMTYWPEGWYECNQFEEVHWGLGSDPTHWMPLPSPPSKEVTT